MVPYLKTIMKAIVGALVTGLTALVVALDDGEISQQEWLKAAIAFLSALIVVWAVPNITEKVQNGSRSNS
jgi:hypothetical protein